ncbi:hypothetical protein [Candidatus Neptunochlamydia vexilliferae]|uniref:hypothetical protein n=1 Tax=Candidatus Neptunichlamydia vexilliferae TaxID=1651774 RepID=UPI001890D138|nr:hypothetical protein [Candidatus Neptunochlamydia vexilliferae]
MGGLQTGRESLQFIPDHKEYPLVVYEYPEAIKELHKTTILGKPLNSRSVSKLLRGYFPLQAKKTHF